MTRVTEPFISLGDLDMWTLSTSEGSPIDVTMARTDEEGDLNPWIRLLSPSGELLGEHRAFEEAQVSVDAPVTGTYTVIVGSNGSPGTQAGTPPACASPAWCWASNLIGHR
jgi:hypothetical protein